MNVKELEALVKQQGERIEQLGAVINEQAKEIIRFEETVNLARGLSDIVAEVNDDINKLKKQMGIEEDIDPFYPEFLELSAKVEELTSMIEGRNKSAPTKRNMTDADAIRVMTGDLKDLSHKEAAEQANLTYAQVYSCRLEYTFKHVHKQLRDENKEFKNPWSK